MPRAPKRWTSCQTLKPRTQGMEPKKTSGSRMRTLFLRLQQKLAKVMNRKKSPPQSCPIGILMKIFGSATKIRDGPSAGATPKAKQAGKMMRPAMMATKVSRIVMRTASPVSELSLLI